MSKRSEFAKAGYLVLTPSQVGGFYCPLKAKLDRESSDGRLQITTYSGTLMHRYAAKILEASFKITEDRAFLEAAIANDLRRASTEGEIDERSGKQMLPLKLEE